MSSQPWLLPQCLQRRRQSPTRHVEQTLIGALDDEVRLTNTAQVSLTSYYLKFIYTLVFHE